MIVNTDLSDRTGSVLRSFCALSSGPNMQGDGSYIQIRRFGAMDTFYFDISVIHSI
jgi:hypothetical protein